MKRIIIMLGIVLLVIFGHMAWEQYLFEKSEIYNLYYNQLSKPEKILYNQMYNGFSNNYSFFVTNIPKDSADRVVSALCDENPEFYWLTDSYYEVRMFDHVMFLYFPNHTDKNAKELMDDEVNKIISAVKTDDDVETIRNLHDYLIENYEYSKDNEFNQNIIGLLLEGRGTCASFARTFQYIAQELGYTVYSVPGTSDSGDGVENHLWNIIEINEQWYWMDVTLDIYRLGVPVHTFELISDDYLIAHHFEQEFIYPECTDTSYQDFLNRDYYFTENDYNQYVKTATSQYESDGHIVFKFADEVTYEEAITYLDGEDGYLGDILREATGLRSFSYSKNFRDDVFELIVDDISTEG